MEAKMIESETIKQQQNNKKIEKEKEKQVKARMKAANNIQLDSFKVDYKLNLMAEEAAYMLIIDSKLPIS